VDSIAKRCEEPFSCFSQVRNVMARLDHKSMSEVAPFLRFVGFGIIMALANVLPYLSTRGSYDVADGYEVAGWPLQCYAAGGFSFAVYFRPWAMAGNIVIAVIISAFAAWLFRRGERRTLRIWKIRGIRMWRTLRTWGTPFEKNGGRSSRPSPTANNWPHSRLSVPCARFSPIHADFFFTLSIPFTATECKTAARAMISTMTESNVPFRT